MNDTLKNVFDLCGKIIHIESEIFCSNEEYRRGYTIDHIEIRDRHHATFVLTSHNPCAQPFEWCFTAEELNNLANIGKIIRGNDEIYITTN
ncbi:MAG: hypothetical protein II630_06480 [Bacteroidales bacterium]|nr:hypothetical protein [Bacteroidales bacterium]